MKMADEVKKESKKEKNGIGTFIDSVKKEYKKIVWPTRDRLTKETIAVVVSSVILGIIITSLYRMLIKLGIYNKVPSKKKKYEPKLYQPMRYPGERVQVDVKYVPKACMTKELIERNERYYQYTAIDEYTRQRVIWFAKEHSTYESSKFIDIIVKKFNPAYSLIITFS